MKWLNRFFYIFNNFIFIPLVLVLTYHYLYAFCNECIYKVIPSTLFISILILDAIYLVLLGVTGKSNVSYLILILGLFLLFVVNQIKIIYMNEPLFFSDFNFIDQTSNLLDIIGDSFWGEIKFFLKFFGILLVICFIVMFYQSYFRFRVESGKLRIISSFCGLFIIFILFFPFSWSKSLYKDIFFDIDDYFDYYSYTDYISLYSYYDIIGGMYYQLLDNRVDIPDDYDDKKLDDILENVDDVVEHNIGNPNVIVILSESFFDVSLLKEDIVFDKEITSNFNQLKKKEYMVNLVSPSYGGMTANVTFELLTGGNMSYFGQGYIPFMQLYNNDSKFVSIVNDLANNGYETQIFMGNDSYNSEELLLNLGFEKYIEIEETNDNIKGNWVSDDYVADMIIDSMNNTKGKKFIMVETMQSHMGYLPTKYSNYDIEVSNSGLDSDCNDVLLSYAQGVYDADKMLKKIYDYIQSIDEETILIFFGDHLPYLESQNGENILDELLYFNTNDDLVNLYRRYNTQALIVSNYNVDLDLEEVNYMGFDLLLTSLVNQMDIEVDSYYRWLYSTKDVLSAYNRYMMVDKNGNLYNIDNVPEEMQEVYKLRNLMMYKMFVNS